MMDRFSERHPIVLDAPDRPVNVDADGERFQRVVENLINNAIKYSPDGGAVELSISSDREHAVIRVRDYGIGISSEALPRIFEASYRAREAVTCAPGLGLGLSIASQVIALHGGTIEAAPAEARGTIVTVQLPLAPVPREEAAATLTQPAQSKPRDSTTNRGNADVLSLPVLSPRTFRPSSRNRGRRPDQGHGIGARGKPKLT
jgi:K+-sensing histidine kinase KdpD